MWLTYNMKAENSVNIPVSPAPIPSLAWQNLPWGSIGIGAGIFFSVVWVLFDRQISRARGRFMLSDLDSLQSLLNRVLVTTKSDRVVVVEFQGERGTRMVPIVEVTRTGIVKVTPAIDCRTTCTASIVESLRVVPLKKQEASQIVDPSYRQFLEGLGVNFASYSLLLDKDRVLGFLAIHYASEGARSLWEAVELEDISEDVGAICLQLSQGNQRLNRLMGAVSILRKGR
jgi:hypothetical protein